MSDQATAQSFQLPPLPYAKDALEPHIDAQTMEVHHDKHHAGYTKKLNAALEGSGHEGKSIEDILGNISQMSTAVRNNGGGYYNHDLFWKVMGPDGGGSPSGSIGEAINSTFGSYDKFKEEFKAAATGQFGSGWAWLIVDGSGNLKITSTPNQDNPLMDIAEVKGTPILGIDVWEHAYYLKYQNKRPDYVEAFFNVINWREVNKRYEAAKRLSQFALKSTWKTP
ncbi:MAG: superoxide dismutase [Owenweeksia sp.]|nr:superoxide dismutase [Owenweeksia sp.]